MLHKKKRWTAAMHGTGQSPIPVLLPASSSPTKTQWSNFSPSTGNKPVSRHPTPPSSTQMFKPQTPTAYSAQHSVDGFSAASKLNLSRTTTTADGLQSSARLSSPVIPSVVSEAISGFCTPNIRNEAVVSLLNSLTQSTELLQQPGLLLQILPQDCIEKYAKGLERRIASDKAAYDLVNCAVKSDGNNRPNEMATPPALYRNAQAVHSSESHHSSTAGPSNNTSSHKPNSFVEQGKPTRSTPTIKGSGGSQTPLFSFPASSNSDPQRFSPARHSSGSSDSHPNAVWTRTGSSPSAQTPSGLDYSTASAVAHAANLLHTASRSNAATALFAPWDGLNQVAIPREMSTRPDSAAGALYSQTLSMTPSPGGFYPDSRNLHINRSPGNSVNMQRHRTPHESTQPTAQVSAPINLKPVPDPRRPVPKAAVTPTCRQLDVRMQAPGKNCVTINEATTRSFHVNQTWGPAEQLANSNIGPSLGSETAADARLSILHDAKMAALSADWPSSGSPGNNNNNNNNNNASLKHQRTRSSSSFSSPMSSSSEVSPMLHIPTQQTHASRNATVRDVFHASPSSSSMISATQNTLIHPRPSVTCSSPISVTKPVKSSPSGHSPVYAISLPTSRQTGQGSSPVSNTLIQGNRGLVPIYNRTLDDKLPTHFHGTPHTAGKSTAQPPHVYNNNNSKLFTDHWAKSLSHNPPKPPSLTINTSNGENTLGKQPPTDRSCSLMPLKKRLIQRYEADTGSDQIDHVTHKLSPSSLHSHSTYLVASGHSSQTSSTVDFVAGPQHSRLLIASQSPLPAMQKTGLSSQSPSFDNVSKATQDDSSELKTTTKPQTQGFFHRSADIPERKSVKRSNTATAAHRRSGGLNGTRKVGSGARLSDGCARSGKPIKYEASSASAIKTEPIETKPTRKSIARQRSGRADRFPMPMEDGVLNRSAASSNGTFASTAVSRVRRTGSSASHGSSCSLRSLGAETDDSEDDHVYHSDQVSDVQRIGKAAAADRATVDRSTWDSNHSLNDRVRKPKRAAALVASAAAAASVTTNVKRPRLSAHPEPGMRRNNPGLPDEDSVEDESLDTDDACSVMTTDSKCTNATNSENSSPLLDELSAVLVEDKTSIEELVQQLPGPPDLQLLTDRSLHPTHTLDHYKRSRAAFVQLVSCNDPGLKPIPKCRACRQLKRAHYDVNDPDLADPVSDEDGRMDNHSVLSKSSSTASRTTPAASAVSGQFKRPAGGRNSLTDRDKSRDCSNDGAPLKSEKSRRRTTAASSPVSVFCRFWGFRKLMFNNRGILKIAGFCQSNEASAVDRSLWEMHHSVSPPLDPDNAKYIVERAGTLFCRLLRQELAVLTTHRGQDPNLVDRGPGAPSKNGLRRGGNSALAVRAPSYTGISVAWKRPVKGVREMCDVCETTMFNTHWVCAKCGYSVCVDCQEEAREHKRNRKSDADSDACDTGLSRDRSKMKQPRTRAGPPGWASCTTTRQHHDPERLLLTSLLPASTVGKLLHRVHRIARHYQIRLACGCPVAGSADVSLLAPTVLGQPTATLTENSLGLLADVALNSNSPEPPSTVAKREWDLIHHVSGLGSSSSSSCGGGASQRLDDSKPIPPHTWIRKPYPLSPPKQKPESDECNTAKYLVLQLHNAQSPGVLEAFQHEWQTNRPVVISGCQSRFDSSLWSPRSFADEFGPLRTTLVDCATGMELTRYPLRTFWDGFERKSRRLVSKDGRPLCLKLKDWPTTDDFAELQPNRFADLMNNLPLPCYTCRDGQMNLSSRLASFFVCPDLGPKLYVAYGTGGSRSVGFEICCIPELYFCFCLVD